MSRRPRVLAVVLAAAFLSIGACRSKPTAGSKCKIPDQLVCASADRALVCDSSAWAEVPCKGPRGCAKRADGDECDDTSAADGDRCPNNPPLDYACTPDRKKALVCKDGSFALWRECRGPDGCKFDGRNVHCDTTLGEQGDPCAQQGTYACSTDKKTMLLCDGSTFSGASSCRGPDGCHIQHDSRKVECDDSVAQEGDACDQPKRIACSLDRKAELVCSDGKYVRKRECRRSDCRLEGNELYCD